MAENLIKIGIEGDSIIIRCKIDDLVFITENDPSASYKVLDKKQFAEDFCEKLKNSTAHSGAEGINAVEDLFEETYHNVYGSASDAIIDQQEEMY